ncbi:MAG TPA: FmdB family zinc ribbon protein [Planctomycetota bacterium]|nr:FmdB family zinc ribbon protein [Planctomycetota bacterium]
MPTYDYACAACGHRFEHFQSFSEPLLKRCPQCGKDRLERLIGSGAGILFKGSGFYQTDYKKAAPPGEGKAPEAATPKSGAKDKADGPAKAGKEPGKPDAPGSTAPGGKPAATPGPKGAGSDAPKGPAPKDGQSG